MHEKKDLKEVVQARIKEIRETEEKKKTETLERELSMQKRLKKQVEDFIQFILPLTIEHFSKTNVPYLLHTKLPIKRDYPEQFSNLFTIVDELTDGDIPIHTFHLKGCLEDLEIGKGESIVLKEILDDRLKEILTTDDTDPNTTYWDTPAIYEDWVLFHGRGEQFYSGQDGFGKRGRTLKWPRYHRVLICRLVGGVMKLITEFNPRTQIIKERFGAEGRISHNSQFDKLFMQEHNGIRYISIQISRELIENIFVVRPDNTLMETKLFESSFPDFNNTFQLSLLEEFFLEVGLTPKVINSDSLRLSITSNPNQ